GDRDSTSSGREDHLAVKIDQECRVIARVARARPDAPAPVVAECEEPRPGGIVNERLVEPETVAAVGRIPGVRARLAVAKAERVEPSRALEPREPGVLSGAENRRLLVDAGTARIGVADDDRRAPPPAAEEREGARAESALPPRHPIGDRP